MEHQGVVAFETISKKCCSLQQITTQYQVKCRQISVPVKMQRICTQVFWLGGNGRTGNHCLYYKILGQKTCTLIFPHQNVTPSPQHSDEGPQPSFLHAELGSDKQYLLDK